MSKFEIRVMMSLQLNSESYLYLNPNNLIDVRNKMIITKLFIELVPSFCLLTAP